nr:MAG: hypothetical protein TU36_01320 [Vulcanisaeta sp. AZ3]
MNSSYDECIRLLREVLERLEAIEGELDMIREEIKELQSGGRERTISGTFQEGRGLIKAISDNLFLDTKDIVAKGLLRRLIANGRLVLLRDETANREVVTTKEVVRNLLSKLPISVNDIDKLSDREYELLLILNRLGYVLLRDNKYVVTEAAKEFI